MASTVWRGFVTFGVISIPYGSSAQPVPRGLAFDDCAAKRLPQSLTRHPKKKPIPG